MAERDKTLHVFRKRSRQLDSDDEEIKILKEIGKPLGKTTAIKLINKGHTLQRYTGFDSVHSLKKLNNFCDQSDDSESECDMPTATSEQRTHALKAQTTHLRCPYAPKTKDSCASETENPSTTLNSNIPKTGVPSTLKPADPLTTVVSVEFVTGNPSTTLNSNIPKTGVPSTSKPPDPLTTVVSAEFVTKKHIFPFSPDNAINSSTRKYVEEPWTSDEDYPLKYLYPSQSKLPNKAHESNVSIPNEERRKLSKKKKKIRKEKKRCERNPDSLKQPNNKMRLILKKTHDTNSDEYMSYYK